MPKMIRCGQCDNVLELPDGDPRSYVRCPDCDAVLSLTPSPVAAAPADKKPATGSNNLSTSRPQVVNSPAPAPASGKTPPPKLPPIDFSSRKNNDDDEDLDMTPMVDVTFLLLIFFMVTATFSMQKSLEVPPPDREENAAQARTIREIEQDDDYIIVRIAPDDTIWVNDREASSKQDLLVKLRETRSEMSAGGLPPRNLLVLADQDSRYESLVSAIDAGNAVGIDSIRFSVVDDDDF